MIIFYIFFSKFSKVKFLNPPRTTSMVKLKTDARKVTGWIGAVETCGLFKFPGMDQASTTLILSSRLTLLFG